MANTFELISSVTVGSGGAADITFSSISSSFTDLCVKVSARSSAAPTTVQMMLTFNASTSSYSGKFLYGDGGSAASGNSATSYIRLGEMNAASTTSNTFTSAEIYLPNYAGSSYKSVSLDSVSENNGTEAYAWMTAGLWSNTAAISTIKLAPSSGNFVQYSTAYLYGVKNA